MAEQISIWRWAITEDLEARFAAFLAASDDSFARMAHEIADEDASDVLSPAEIAAQTEAKVRAMGLPEDILQSTLAGLREMVAEAEADLAVEDEDDLEAFHSDQIGISLASSHMFFDDPYASIDYDERERQIDTLLDSYAAAMTKACGQPPQTLAQYLGLTPAQFDSDQTEDVLMEAQLDGVTHLWVQGDVTHFLSIWHEDKELPIDVGFMRMPKDVLMRLKAQL